MHDNWVLVPLNHSAGKHLRTSAKKGQSFDHTILSAWHRGDVMAHITYVHYVFGQKIHEETFPYVTARVFSGSKRGLKMAPSMKMTDCIENLPQ